MNIKNILKLLMIVLLPFTAGADCKDFANWKQNFKEIQKNIGISEDILRETVDAAVFQRRIIKSDRSQPEFSFNFETYLQKMHSQVRVDRAIKKYKELKTELDILEEKYGVAGEYLVAFWAIETNFGEYQGKLKARDALATLSCDQRRSRFFSEEYSIFIRLVSEGKLPADAHSSWAGAMGHLQFLPNKIEKYALDGDGDNNIDIFSSRKDAFETAANYLKGEGWQKGEIWGEAVNITQKIPQELMGRKNKKTLEIWQKLGVASQNDEKFIHGLEQKAGLLSLKTGENFIVYDNFDVIMIWNHSIHYALAIGLLADKIKKSYVVE